MSKLLRELSETEFNRLKDVGMLWKIYPNAPESYLEVAREECKRIGQLESDKFIDILKVFHSCFREVDRAKIFWNSFVQIKDEYLKELRK